METDSNFFLMFGRLEGKVDALLSQQGRTDTRLDDLEGRLNNLETIKHQGTGMFRVVHIAWAGAVAAVVLFIDDIKGFVIR